MPRHLLLRSPAASDVERQFLPYPYSMRERPRSYPLRHRADDRTPLPRAILPDEGHGGIPRHALSGEELI